MPHRLRLHAIYSTSASLCLLLLCISLSAVAVIANPRIVAESTTVEQETPLEHSCLAPGEMALAVLVNTYRADNGLPAVKLSQYLTKVAQLHVRDLSTNFSLDAKNIHRLHCSLHSWSNKGLWMPVCYTHDRASVAGMLNKPREITANTYTGNGYEIAYWSSGPATAGRTLQGWQRSPQHNAVILETDGWAGKRWPVMGVGMHNNYAVVWFGDQPDPPGGGAPCQPSTAVQFLTPMSAVPTTSDTLPGRRARFP
jgi:hypothetical protein